MIHSDFIAVFKVSLERGIEYQHETGLCVIWRGFSIVCYLTKDFTDIQTNDVEGVGVSHKLPRKTESCWIQNVSGQDNGTGPASQLGHGEAVNMMRHVNS